MIRLPGPPRQQHQIRGTPARNEHGKVRDRDYGKPLDILDALMRMLRGEL